MRRWKPEALRPLSIPILKGLSDEHVTVADVDTSVAAALVEVMLPNGSALVASVQLAVIVAETAIVPVSVPALAPVEATARPTTAKHAIFLNISEPFRDSTRELELEEASKAERKTSSSLIANPDTIHLDHTSIITGQR